jgi:hypothetical protein
MNKKNQNPAVRIPHLIRYFILIGAVVFFGYLNHWQDFLFLIFIGPVLYLADNLHNLFSGIVEIPSTFNINFYGFLLPLSVIYYSFLGFLIKQLFNERGSIRLLSIFALFGFLIFIHYFAWKNLTGYSLQPV